MPGARQIVRTETPKNPLLVAGDGQGLLEAAAAGLLATKPTIFYSGTFAHDKAGLDKQLQNGAVLVLTDSNQKQLSTWGSVTQNYGYVEQANETPLGNQPSEVALPVFPGAGSNTQTVAVVNGVASVRATAYGNPITNLPEDQPLNAVDGNPATSWTEGAFVPAINQSIQVSTVHPVTTDHVTLLQPSAGPKGRTITDVTLKFDGGSPIAATLGASSTKGQGQVVSLPPPDLHDTHHHHRRHQLGPEEELPRRQFRRLLGDLHSRGRAGHGGAAPADGSPLCGRNRLPLPPARHPAQPDPGGCHTAAHGPRDDDQPGIHPAHGPVVLHRGHGTDLSPRPRSRTGRADRSART